MVNDGRASVVVDIERCCGSGQCALSVPEVFDQSEQSGLVVLLDAHPPGHLLPRLRDAANRCPSGAITVDDVHPNEREGGALPASQPVGW
jgi:ferredoxin